MTILESEDGKFFINAGKKIEAQKKLDWHDAFHGLIGAEELYRNALYSTLNGSAGFAHGHPFNSSRMKPKNAGNTDQLFKSSTVSGSTRKFLYFKTLSFSKDWLQENGYIPSQTTRGHAPSRILKGFPVAETLYELDETEASSFLTYHILTEETRVELSNGIFESSLEMDFRRIEATLQSQSVKKRDPLDALNKLLNEALEIGPDPRKNNRLKPFRRAALHYLHYLAHKGQILLPTPRMAHTRNTISTLYPAIMRGPLILRMTGPRTEEFLHVHQFCSMFHKGRSVSPLINFSIFCGTTYLAGTEFDPDYLYMTRNALSGEKHDLRLYLNGCTDFHGVSRDEARRWMQTFKDRRSKVYIEDPLSFFTEDPAKIRSAMPVQVRNYEEKTGKTFPNKIPKEIVQWAYELDRLVKMTPRRSYQTIYRSCRLWLTYLSTLEQPPRDFSEVNRSSHISDESRNGSKTFKSALEKWGMTPREPLNNLHQLFDIWASEQIQEQHNPLKPGKDWKNPAKKFGTSRKSIPTLIVETLIEENAKADDDGIPYALYRQWKSKAKARTFLKFDGKQPEEVIPAVAAALDCILTFGMRSSSARWMDSGQGDEFSVSKNNRKLVKNTSDEATKGRRAGAIQIMEISEGNKIFSLLLMKTKNDKPLEIPFLPEEIHERILYIAALQAEHNPIAVPVPAVDDKSIASLRANNLYVYPLFLNPVTGKDPVTSTALHTWWRELLRISEDVVHQKRVADLGPNTARLKFFDKSGSPIWDIHTIRVSVATALLDQGVPPTVVQQFLGHATLVMTLHYHAIGPERVQAEITAAWEKRRLSALRALSETENEDELDAIVNDLFGGLSNSVGSDEGIQLAKEYLTKRGPLANSPDAISVFSHGVCPGASCSTGGERKGSYHFGVHRDKACSRCRFRLTGPAFLSGLVMNANILVLEIGDSVRKEQNLNKELLEASRAGQPVGIIETRISQERSFRDELWADWAAEYKTIDECIKLQSDGHEDLGVPVELGQVSHGIREGDVFDLVQTILSNTDMIVGARMDIPPGLIERRNEMLWDIASRNGDVGKFLLSLPQNERTEALNRYGELVAAVPEALRAEISVNSLRKQLRAIVQPKKRISSKGLS
ncbi:MAG: tyrosine-type recombinase/integrase [Pseudomonadota bacterium]|nr:tyrosine-type recombinase/integrase [Pseudomonadota bacterium]